MMYLWHEWRAKKASLKGFEDERKEANARIWKNLNAELKAARQAKDWDKANILKAHVANYRTEKSDARWSAITPFDARYNFRKWDY